jgi:hypothetical protein
MDKIKFRSSHYFHKDKSFSHFSYWGMIDHKSNHKVDSFTSPSSSSNSFRKTEEQYIGLKDKNGKEIYEGDIVKTGFKMDGSIYFSTPCFGVQNSTGVCTEFEWDEIEKFEIIGNIHENPELCK